MLQVLIMIQRAQSQLNFFIKILIQQANYQIARKYWNKLKERLKKEDNESVSNCHQLKFKASDGKFYLICQDKPLITI